MSPAISRPSDGPPLLIPARDRRFACPPPKQLRVELASGSLSADVWDQGTEGVLVLHGLPGSRRSLRPLAARLGATRAVVAPDLLGFGESTTVERPSPHARGQATALLALLEQPPLSTCRRIHLAGCDFGGPTAVWLAHLAPARFASLALAASNLFADTPIPLPLRSLKLPGIGAVLASAMWSRWGLRGLWRFAAADRIALPWDSFWADAGAPSSRLSGRQILLTSLRNLETLYGPIQEMLSTISVPTLVAWGCRDPFFPRSQAQRTAEAIPGSRLIVFENCGHFVAEERPTELAAALQELFGLVGGETRVDEGGPGWSP